MKRSFIPLAKASVAGNTQIKPGAVTIRTLGPRQYQQSDNTNIPTHAIIMTSNNTSRNTQSGTNGNTVKDRLTDAEKKQNHILSEQKRRQAIRQGFDRLAEMTPGMTGMGRSEANVLAHATAELKHQLAMKEIIKRKLMAKNPQVSDQFFESLYEVTPTAPLPASASPAASTGSGGSKGKGKQKAKDNN